MSGMEMERSNLAFGINKYPLLDIIVIIKVYVYIMTFSNNTRIKTRLPRLHPPNNQGRETKQ